MEPCQNQPWIIKVLVGILALDDQVGVCLIIEGSKRQILLFI